MVLLLLFYSNHVHILLFLYTFIHISYLIIVFLLTLVLIAAYDPVLRIVFYTLVIYVFFPRSQTNNACNAFRG